MEGSLVTRVGPLLVLMALVIGRVIVGLGLANGEDGFVGLEGRGYAAGAGGRGRRGPRGGRGALETAVALAAVAAMLGSFTALGGIVEPEPGRYVLFKHYGAEAVGLWVAKRARV